MFGDHPTSPFKSTQEKTSPPLPPQTTHPQIGDPEGGGALILGSPSRAGPGVDSCAFRASGARRPFLGRVGKGERSRVGEWGIPTISISAFFFFKFNFIFSERNPALSPVYKWETDGLCRRVGDPEASNRGAARPAHARVPTAGCARVCARLCGLPPAACARLLAGGAGASLPAPAPRFPSLPRGFCLEGVMGLCVYERVCFWISD